MIVCVMSWHFDKAFGDLKGRAAQCLKGGGVNMIFFIYFKS